ncbi:MAG: hypothetical protein U0X75_17785 [Acidobacteriota bacterium]
MADGTTESNAASPQAGSDVDGEAKRWIVEQTCTDRSYGARPLRRALQRYVEDPLSDALIQGQLGTASFVEVFLEGEALGIRPVLGEGWEEAEEALTH